MSKQYGRSLMLFVFLFIPLLNLAPAQEKKEPPKPQDMLRSATRELIKLQEDEGQWTYDNTGDEGMFFCFQVGCTSIVAQALLFAAPNDKDAQAAVQRGLAFVLKQLDDPQITSSTKDVYDVRIWGQGYALEFLCHVRALKKAGDHEKEVAQWITRLVKTIVEEEIPGGGWSYGGRSTGQASFVTAPIAQALLLAQSQGEKVPSKVFKRARKVLKAARMEDGAFVYRHSASHKETRAKPGSSLGGSAGRGLVCATTLVLLGEGSTDDIQFALDNFYEHWDDLEERRQQSGTHAGPYNIAPYYFYFGHRYAAQAIEMLPPEARVKQRQRLSKILLKTREEDGTWNDRNVETARSYGTAMVIQALVSDQTPLPPRLKKKASEAAQKPNAKYN